VSRYMRNENGAVYDLRSLARAIPTREAYKDIRTSAEGTETKE
jgi:hypothetical protein